MSGIAGILNLDGTPVDRGLLSAMTTAMTGRGPDANGMWCSGNVGFGHAMLRLQNEPDGESQPFTLDGRVWITADARIDGRVELIGALRAAGHRLLDDAPAVELILRAYDAFGESFLDYLIGDFAFAIWDSRHTTLISSRDHFGVRPLFYAKTDRSFLFASDLDSLLQHPATSAHIDEEAIGDFLLFGEYQIPEISIFRHIRRLPAANCIRLDRDGFKMRRYWTLPSHGEIRYGKDSDYVDRFQELFGAAVNDRSRPNQVAVELSGGMDSTSIAAVAKSGARGRARSITAYTTTCHGLLPDDQEGSFAAMVASHLCIPIVEQASENHVLFERFDDPVLRTAEPVANPGLAAQHDNFSRMGSTGTRVLLSGQGGDAGLSNTGVYYANLFRAGQIARFLTEACRHVRQSGSLRGLGLRAALMGSKRSVPWQPAFPDWLNADFVRRTQLRDRWDAAWRVMHAGVGARAQLSMPWISSVFETYESLKMPLVVRHPFFDVRLVTFLLGLPDYMRSRKHILREAMRGALPEAVRTREKTYLAGDLIRAKFAIGKVRIPATVRLAQVDCEFVDWGRYRQAFERYMNGEGIESTWSSSYMITPLALDNWLTQRFRSI